MKHGKYKSGCLEVRIVLNPEESVKIKKLADDYTLSVSSYVKRLVKIDIKDIKK